MKYSTSPKTDTVFSKQKEWLIEMEEKEITINEIVIVGGIGSLVPELPTNPKKGISSTSKASLIDYSNKFSRVKFSTDKCFAIGLPFPYCSMHLLKAQRANVCFLVCVDVCLIYFSIYCSSHFN